VAPERVRSTSSGHRRRSASPRRRRRARVDIDSRSTPPPPRHTDPGLLRQILVNLVTNAVDAVGRASGARPVVVSTHVHDGKVSIAVRDDGVGIAPEDAAAFEPFYTTKGRGKGTGLGLAICVSWPPRSAAASPSTRPPAAARPSP